MSKNIILIFVLIIIVGSGFFWWKYQKNEKELNRNLTEEERIEVDKNDKREKFIDEIWNTIKTTISKVTTSGPASILQLTQKESLFKSNPQANEKPKFELLETSPQKSENKESSNSPIIQKKREERKEAEEAEKEKKEHVEKTEKKDNEKNEGCAPNSININTASVKELEKIIEVGPTIAQRIIESRPFSSLNDLVKVKGIGEKTLQKIINQGCAYVENSNQRLSQAAIEDKDRKDDKAPLPIASSTSSVPSYPKILISEIQIEPKEERFIELYNPNDYQIDLTGWYLQRKTETSNSWSSLISSTKFEGKIIPAKSHFLIASSSEADIILNLTLTPNNTLRLRNPDQETVDLVGWGNAKEFETAPAENPSVRKSLGRKWSTTSENYLDTNNNQEDFKIQNPTPKTQNENPNSNQPPIAQFTFTPTDPIVNQQILFDASLSKDPDGTISNYLWNFGDGNSTTTLSVTTTHFYSTSGDFIVTLLVIDNFGVTSSPVTTAIKVSEHQEVISSVVINEVAWMGTAASSNDEWIELHNFSQNWIDLTGWKLISLTDDSPNIILSGEIPPLEFYLLERTASSTTDINEDQIYKGALNNNPKCEILALYDQNNNLVDQTICLKNGWPAGNNSTKQTMERINPQKSGQDPNNWADNNAQIKNGLDAAGNPINGTPRAQNSVYLKDMP